MSRVVHPWWQYIPSLGKAMPLTSVGGVAGKVRRIWDAPLGPSRSSGTSYQKIFGATQFCAPIPVGAPDAIPEDPYRAGRKLDSVTNVSAWPWPTMNTNDWNLPTHVVDTSLPPGPVESGGGNYTMQKVYQRAHHPGWFRIKRGGGLYQPMTDSLPIPLNLAPSGGLDGASTDKSSSVTDVGPARLNPNVGPKVFEFWQLRKGDGTTAFTMASDPLDPAYRIVDTRDPRPSDSDGYEYIKPVPAGAWCYTTCGICEDTALSDGSFDNNKGNVVASGLIGAALQIGIDEALLACGMVRDASGAITNVPPVVDAIQHMIGIEYAAVTAQKGVSWPATFSDAAYEGDDQIMYGQRLYFDPALVDLDAITDPFAKALTWTGMTYGFTGTDKGGNFAFRGEAWADPQDGTVDPWAVLVGALSGGRTKRGTIAAMPWLTIRSMPKDYGKPGTATAGLMATIGRG